MVVIPQTLVRILAAVGGSLHANVMIIMLTLFEILLQCGIVAGRVLVIQVGDEGVTVLQGFVFIKVEGELGVRLLYLGRKGLRGDSFF